MKVRLDMRVLRWKGNTKWSGTDGRGGGNKPAETLEQGGVLMGVMTH